MSPRNLSGHDHPQPTAERQDDFASRLQRKGVTLTLLWEEYRGAAVGVPYSRSRFFERYQDFVGTLRRSMRQTHVAGEKLFVDYAGQTVPVIDAASGEERRAHVFVAVWGASNFTYAAYSGEVEQRFR